jgi:hypothetical protein
MRSEILTYLTTELKGKGVNVSQELPWFSGTEPLYNKNMKTVYLDHEETSQEVIIEVFGPCPDVVEETTSLVAYLQVDAKNQLPNISNILSIIKSAKDISTIVSVGDRLCDIETEIVSDNILYTITYSITRIT